MSSTSNTHWAAGSLWASYKNNFARHLLGVSRHLQFETMKRLSERMGHQHLRLNFEPYLSLLNEEGLRITELAEQLEISKQACNQTANQIEKAGYIRRQADPYDGRARRIVLTPKGRQLQLDGLQVSAEVHSEYAALVGSQDLSAVVASLSALDGALGLTGGRVGSAGQVIADIGEGALLAGLLPRLADYVTRRLMALTMAKGHPGLKPSFGQVLTLIGPEGGRINRIAAIQKVSKQAVSATVSELSRLGYLERRPEPRDARQVLIHLTAQGRDLITDSVEALNGLNEALEVLLGGADFEHFKAVLLHLYQGLCIESEVFSPAENIDLDVMAQQLKSQLGDEAVRKLVELLLKK